MLTFKNLQDRVLRALDEAGDTDTTLALVQDFLNASHRRVALSQRWPWLKWPRQETITQAAGIRTYALHPSVAALTHLWDVDSRLYVPVLPSRQVEAHGVEQSSDADGYGATLGPLWPVAKQPQDATITLVSTDVGDVSALVLEGTDSTNTWVTETLTCVGVTPVVSSTVWRVLLKVTSTGVPTGTRTLTSGSDTLLSLTPTQVGKVYPTVEFLNEPVAGRTFTYGFRRDLPAMTLDNEIPVIHPNSAAEILIYDALLDFSTYNTELGEAQVKLWKHRYDAIWKQLTDTNEDLGIMGSQVRTVREVGDPQRFVRSA